MLLKSSLTYLSVLEERSVNFFFFFFGIAEIHWWIYLVYCFFPPAQGRGQERNLTSSLREAHKWAKPSCCLSLCLLSLTRSWSAVEQGWCSSQTSCPHPDSSQISSTELVPVPVPCPHLLEQAQPRAVCGLLPHLGIQFWGLAPRWN